jgi:hypothetical protein
MRKTYGVGIDAEKRAVNKKKKIQYINLKLAAQGFPYYQDERSAQFLEIATPLLDNYKEQSRLLASHLSPIEKRVQTFLDDYFADGPGKKNISLPGNSFVLDTHGLARMMSISPGKDCYETDMVKSYRTSQGILHNPKGDKRTTKGVFHICEGGLPIPNDKKAVPKETFAKLLEAALNPPKDLMELPFTSDQDDKAELFMSLMLRPIVVPEVHGVTKEKSMEVLFLAPGSLISNLDFVESIFGNAGDPNLPENDAALDPEGWTGHTGCVIMATHLVHVKKKDMGLPHYNNATERQRREGMCWKDENERYNDGGAFKITARDERGVVVTIIADNYFGYCKKEVKTQISYSANLFGLAEEEHAGGAIAYPGYDLGERYVLDESLLPSTMTFKEFTALYSDMMNLHPEGYGTDKNYPNIIYVPENARFNIFEQSVSWTNDQATYSIKLLPANHYVLPSGYRIRMRKRLNGHHWHLTGAVGEGTLCHKPCTVSGGGKSEISKSIRDAMIQGSVIVSDLSGDLDMVEEIMQKDFSHRFKIPVDYKRPPRSILDADRSLGSVIKLLTPANEYTDEYNDWLKSVPQRIKDLIYIVKRRYHNEWSQYWREYFSVDQINGSPGNELKFMNRKLISNYLRVGHDLDNSWRIFQLRQDFYPAQKIQVEDDITASIIVRSDRLSYLNSNYDNPSVKLVTNCEARLFQRPDDCIIKGYDKQAESDIASPNTFLSNFEPLTREQVKEIKEDTIGFDFYSRPVKDLINNFLASDEPEYLVVPSEPRLVNGVPSQNPRYLQVRPDFVDPIEKYLAETCTRIYRRIPLDKALYQPVNSVLPGRRNNPSDPKNKVPPLAIYSPVHYQELPELFIDFICSVTGKSPSTTGFGSEGALTKGPFNNLLVASDLNNALLSYILTGYEPLSSAAGYVGPKYRVDHDISLLMPEVISRMSVKERDPKYLIENGYLEKVENVEYNGETIEASLLGYRITIKFVRHFLGRIFNKPDAVFTEDMLRPELQDMEAFVQSLKNLFITQKRVAEGLMTDGTYEALCPPLQALLSIMVKGQFEGKDREHPDIRKLFTREYVINSDWYRHRLKVKQERDIKFWNQTIAYLEDAIGRENLKEAVQKLELESKLKTARKELAHVQSEAYLNELYGTLGADPLK